MYRHGFYDTFDGIIVAGPYTVFQIIAAMAAHLTCIEPVIVRLDWEHPGQEQILWQRIHIYFQVALNYIFTETSIYIFVSCRFALYKSPGFIGFKAEVRRGKRLEGIEIFGLESRTGLVYALQARIPQKTEIAADYKYQQQYQRQHPALVFPACRALWESEMIIGSHRLIRTDHYQVLSKYIGAGRR